MEHPVYPARVSQPDSVSGTVTVTIGGNAPVTVPWRGSAMEAVNEALDLLERAPHTQLQSYPFVALEEVLGELTPEARAG